MSADADLIMAKVHNLSDEELLAIQKVIATELQQRTGAQASTLASSETKPRSRSIPIPGSYRPTKEQIESHLAQVFTPEQLAEIEKVDVAKIQLPAGAKTTAELLSEDREDRF